MSAKTSNSLNSNVPPSQPCQPSSPPSPSIVLGYVAAQREYETQIGESAGRRKHRAAKLVPLRVKSVAMDSEFIPLASAQGSLGGYGVVGVTWRPVKGSDAIELPSVETKTGLEFSFKRVQAFGVVLTNAGQLALLPANGLEQALPDGFELVGVVPAPSGTHMIQTHDRVTDEEMYVSGIVFPNTTTPAWVELAKARRERVLAELAEERRERETERRAEMEAEREKERTRREYEAARNRPIRTFQTTDREVVRQMQEEYIARHRGVVSVSEHVSGAIGRDGRSEITYRVADPENFGPAIAERVAAKREELGAVADTHFERERDAREYAASK